MRTELKPSEPCGCGSALLYGECCKRERVRYARDGRGTVFKSIVLDPQGKAVFDEAKSRFREVFGRKPRGKDRMLADSYAYSPADYRRDVLTTFLEAGIPKELAYASSETGLIISSDNAELASPDDLEEWNDAIDRYFEASDAGIDLLAPNQGPVALRLSEFEDLLKLIVIHLGSYADRSPRTTGKSLPVFFQYLLVGKAHQCAKALSKGWGSHLKNETFSLLRSIYECALLIRRLNEEQAFADTLLAQALVGLGPFEYRTKKNGETDFSKILNIETGAMYEARNSYYECAKVASEDESIFFEVIYPFLSSNIHFDAGEFIAAYRNTGSFLIWEESDAPTQAIFYDGNFFLFYNIFTRLDGNNRNSPKRHALYNQQNCQVLLQFICRLG